MSPMAQNKGRSIACGLEPPHCLYSIYSTTYVLNNYSFQPTYTVLNTHVEHVSFISVSLLT